MPPFADDRGLILFDEVCVLCSGFAQFVARHDRAQAFRFASAQSPLGQALYRHYGLDPVDFQTNLLIEDGRAAGKLDGFVRIMSRLGWRFWPVKAVLLLPMGLRNWLYDRIARNRYRLFGKADRCVLAHDDFRSRLIG